MPACALLSVAEHRSNMLKLPAKGAGSQATPKIWGVVRPKLNLAVLFGKNFGVYVGVLKPTRAAFIAVLGRAETGESSPGRKLPKFGQLKLE